MIARSRLLLSTAAGLMLTSILSGAVVTYEAAYHLFPDRPTRLAVEAESLVNALKDAETGQRGFLISGKEAFLQPHQEALPEIQRCLGNLHALADKDDPRVKRLAVLTNAKLDELKALIDARRSGADRGTFDISAGKATMDSIRATSASLVADEGRKVASQTIVQVVVSVLLVATIVFVAIAIILLR